MWKALPRRERWIATGFVAGFGEGFCSHLYFLGVGGIHAFSPDPVVIQVLFQAMLVLDALAVVLVVRASPVGPPLAVAAIVADAAANWWVLAPDVVRRPLHYLIPFGLLPITVFCVFVLVTARPLSRAIRAGGPAAAPAAGRLL